MRVLVIGRFQPLHRGHLKMIGYAASHSQFLTIGLGSCNSSNTRDNPFSAEEREQMLKASLDLTVPYEIKRIPDFGDNKQWVSWIKENIAFDVFYTNSQAERAIFAQAGLKVADIPFFDRDSLSATEVRKRMLEDGDWVSLIPEATVSLLSGIDGIYRIKKLGNSHV